MSLEGEHELDPATELAINPAELDVEWFRQPDLFMKYARATSAAERIAKEAHENVKVVRSRLVREANSDPDGCLGQGNKATGTNVEAYYRNHPDHVAAKDAQVNAEYERDLLQGAKSAIYMKKTALEALVRLSVQGWFAAPIAPRTIEEVQTRLNEVEDKAVETRIAARRKERKDRKEKPSMQRGS